MAINSILISKILLGIVFLLILPALVYRAREEPLEPLALMLPCKDQYLISPQEFDLGQLPRTNLDLRLPASWQLKFEIRGCDAVIQDSRSKVEVWINSSSSFILPKFVDYTPDSEFQSLRLAEETCRGEVCARPGLVMRDEDVSVVLVASYITGRSSKQDVLSAVRQVASGLSAASDREHR